MSSTGASSSSPHPPPQPDHGPYLPTTAGMGGLPTRSVDDPITAVFLALFVLGAVSHMTILQVNLRRGKKFIISGLLFGFCMARITTCTMRLVWADHPTNINVGIAAQVFVSAGVLLLFIINLIFAQRLLRALHPGWAWARWLSLGFKLYYASIVLMLAALITCTVQSFFTLSINTRRIDRDVQLVGATYFTVAAFLPVIIILLAFILPKKSNVEKFGEGRFRTKVFVLLFSTIILTLGAAFRTGTAFVPRPQTNPAWYHSKACFYGFNFVIEIIVVALYAIIRVDKRFHIPNGSRGPGDYSSGGNVGQQNKSSFADRVLDEDQVFGREDGTFEFFEKRNGGVEINRSRVSASGPPPGSRQSGNH
ncbi:Uncharacterized protein BP5553_04199 [Venustampulla echinocandica]|uniref:Family c-likeg-protein-coupled receptor protein n=1 Tax=Venustampulla echinocandica TaxID=2656787 RepID=A0A370TWG3_9HELO|nr:Uncharacterized protein BP5553_04199 [Venustampulla echinocandica]RDL39859.1 Uncharacterized protein BP5553_04199 [Venustampulla echinocandica]